MNYRTKIPIATYRKMIPVGTDVIKSDCMPEQYSMEMGSHDIFFVHMAVVECNPDIYEPVPTKDWTDDDMIEFSRWCENKPRHEHKEVLRSFKIVRDK